MESYRRFAPVLTVLSLCSVLAAPAFPAPAQARPERAGSARFDVAKASVPIKIDGVLDEEAWTAAPVDPPALRVAAGRQHPGAGQDRVPRDL